MASQPHDTTEFPPELVLRPLALVGLSGLDAVNNAVHREVWDAFSSRRAERAPLRFKLLSNTLEFPVVKPKRSSYEWYVPRGILKKNWIHKRISLVPAVVVVFYDMEWDDPQWHERSIECASKVQSVRAALEGHGTRVAVVVLQARPAPPPSEYSLGAERAQALCAACEIQSKSLFVLPHSDHLIGYVVRLENAFYDIAQNYYHHESKLIKQHRERLNKTSHQYLFVRHQFKLGFLNELKQDPSTAHKHYANAYGHLLEMRTTDTNLHEVRTVAGYINYKLCRLLFTLNLPRDSIAQFKSHIERYKNRAGSTELLFEHYAWLARQYSAFGELFDEAIRAGLPAVQSQHPGFYYQHAAQYTAKRRQAARAVCADLPASPAAEPADPAPEYYGQRGGRPARPGADPLDERAAVLALQRAERDFDHSSLVVSFLGCAISQFKTFHSPRTRRRLVVEMADEYYHAADYGKALTLLSHTLWDYRRERWWVLASHVLHAALRCAYLAAKLQDYVQLAVEALSPQMRAPDDDRDRIFANVMSVLDGRAPGPEPGLPAAAAARALRLWEAADAAHTLALDMANISSFLRLKPRFRRPRYRADETVQIELHARLTLPAVLDFKRAHVSVAGPSGTVDIPVTDADSERLRLEGGAPRTFLCEFRPSPRDSGADLRILNVGFVLDSGGGRKIILNFKTDERVIEPAIHPELLHFITGPRAEAEFERIVPATVTSVTSRESRLAVSVANLAPALQGEWFPSTVTVRNGEHRAVHRCELTVSLPASPDNPSPETATELALSPAEARAPPLVLHAGDLAADHEHSLVFYLKTNRAATVTVQIKVSYLVDLPDVPALECVKDFTTKITVVRPFEVHANFAAMNFKPVAKCFTDDPFVVMPQIKISSPRELVIVSTDLELVDCFGWGDESAPRSCLAELPVAEGTVATDAFCVRAKYKPPDAPSRVGLYSITWRRAGGAGEVTSSTPLAAPPVEESPLGVAVQCPAAAALLSCVPLRVTLTGRAARPVRLSVAVEGTDAYMFSGYRQVSLTVPPARAVELRFNIHPLFPGHTAPPRLRATIAGDAAGQDIVNEIFDKVFPDNIFVMPKYNE